MKRKFISLLLVSLMMSSSIPMAYADTLAVTVQSDSIAYKQAIQNLNESTIFTTAEKAVIRTMIEQKHANIQNYGKMTNSKYSTNAVIIPGLPDYNVKNFKLIAEYSKHLTSKDIWAKNGYFFMQGVVISGVTGLISTSVSACQYALTAAGIGVPFLVAGQLAPEIQDGSDCYVSKYFKWNNSYNYEYTVRYDYKVKFKDRYGNTAVLAEGSDYYNGDISEE